jgi:uncharacterized protein (TIGR03067 family)
MVRLCCLVPVIVAAVLTGADASEKDSKSDSALIQGLWHFEECRKNGKPSSSDFIRNLVVQISDDRVSIGILHEGKFQAAFFPHLSLKIKLDTTETPKHLDLSSKEDGKVRTSLLAYSLDGNTLIICGVADQSERTRPNSIPKTIEEEDGLDVVVLKRVRPKDERR